jgi:hypothetical protein
MVSVMTWQVPVRMAVAVAVAALLIVSCSTSSSTTSTSQPAPLATLELAEDGLGDVLVGFPPDVVINDISALYGSPDLDSDWIPAEPNIYGSCPGQVMRAVGWGSLVIIFVNDSADPLSERFYTYTYGYDYTENVGGVDPRGLELTTAAGVGIGSSVAELRAAYGDRVRIAGDSDLDVWSFEIEGATLSGLVDGPDDSNVVTLIELEPGCG